MCWDIVKEEEIQRTKEVTPSSAFDLPVNEDSTEESTLFVSQEPKTAGNLSSGDVDRNWFNDRIDMKKKRWTNISK